MRAAGRSEWLAAAAGTLEKASGIATRCCRSLAGASAPWKRKRSGDYIKSDMGFDTTSLLLLLSVAACNLLIKKLVVVLSIEDRLKAYYH